MSGHIFATVLLFVAMAVTLCTSGLSLFMLVSPSRFRRWWHSWQFPEASEPDRAYKLRWFEAVDTRLAAFFMLIFSVYVSAHIGLAIWKGAAEISPTHSSSHSASEARPNGQLLALGMLLTFAGLLAVTRPLAFSKWWIDRATGRGLPDKALPKYAQHARRFGLFMVAAGLLTLFWWVKSL